MIIAINGINNNYNSGLFYGVYSGYMNDNPNFFNNRLLLPSGTSGTFGTNNQGLVKNIPDITTGTNGFIIQNNGLQLTSIQWIGYFKSNYTGEWTFYTASDDCSYLWIGSNALSGFTTANSLINNGGIHGTREISRKINLVAGEYYPIRIQYGQGYFGYSMNVSFSNPILSKTSNGTGYFFNINNGVMRP